MKALSVCLGLSHVRSQWSCASHASSGTGSNRCSACLGFTWITLGFAWITRCCPLFETAQEVTKQKARMAYMVNLLLWGNTPHLTSNIQMQTMSLPTRGRQCLTAAPSPGSPHGPVHGAAGQLSAQLRRSRASFRNSHIPTGPPSSCLALGPRAASAVRQTGSAVAWSTVPALIVPRAAGTACCLLS